MMINLVNEEEEQEEEGKKEEIFWCKVDSASGVLKHDSKYTEGQKECGFL